MTARKQRPITESQPCVLQFIRPHPEPVEDVPAEEEGDEEEEADHETSDVEDEYDNAVKQPSFTVSQPARSFTVMSAKPARTMVVAPAARVRDESEEDEDSPASHTSNPRPPIASAAPAVVSSATRQNNQDARVTSVHARRNSSEDEHSADDRRVAGQSSSQRPHTAASSDAEDVTFSSDDDERDAAFGVRGAPGTNGRQPQANNFGSSVSAFQASVSPNSSVRRGGDDSDVFDLTRTDVNVSSHSDRSSGTRSQQQQLNSSHSSSGSGITGFKGKRELLHPEISLTLHEEGDENAEIEGNLDSDVSSSQHQSVGEEGDAAEHDDDEVDLASSSDDGKRKKHARKGGKQERDRKHRSSSGDRHKRHKDAKKEHRRHRDDSSDDGNRKRRHSRSHSRSRSRSRHDRHDKDKRREHDRHHRSSSRHRSRSRHSEDSHERRSRRHRDERRGSRSHSHSRSRSDHHRRRGHRDDEGRRSRSHSATVESGGRVASSPSRREVVVLSGATAGSQQGMYQQTAMSARKPSMADLTMYAGTAAVSVSSNIPTGSHVSGQMQPQQVYVPSYGQAVGGYHVMVPPLQMPLVGPSGSSMGVGSQPSSAMSTPRAVVYGASSGESVVVMQQTDSGLVTAQPLPSPSRQASHSLPPRRMHYPSGQLPSPAARLSDRFAVVSQASAVIAPYASDATASTRTVLTPSDANLIIVTTSTPKRADTRRPHSHSNPNSDTSDVDLDSDRERGKAAVRRRGRRSSREDSEDEQKQRSHSVDVTSSVPSQGISAYEGRRDRSGRIRDPVHAYVKAGPRNRSVSPLMRFLRDNNLDYDSDGTESRFYKVPVRALAVKLLRLCCLAICALVIVRALVPRRPPATAPASSSSSPHLPPHSQRTQTC